MFVEKRRNEQIYQKKRDGTATLVLTTRYRYRKTCDAINGNQIGAIAVVRPCCQLSSYYFLPIKRFCDLKWRGGGKRLFWSIGDYWF